MRTRLLILPVLLLLAGAGLIAACASNGHSKAYHNEALGYELRYPGSWQIETQSLSASASGHAQQDYVRLTGPDRDGAPSVVIAVNYDSRWCETGLGQDVSVIYVSGVPGEQYLCTLGTGYACRPAPACREEPYQLVWNFPGERGRLSYVLLGTPGNDLDSIEKVFKSLRFD